MSRFAAAALGLSILMAPDGEGGGTSGGAADPPAAKADPPAAPAAAKIDVDKLTADAKAAARAEFLLESGFKSEEEFQADKKAKKKDAEAKLSEQERVKLALDETLDARGKAEARADKLKAENDTLREQAALRETFDANGVAVGERRVAEVLYTDAKAAAKAKGDTFDAAAFFEEQRKSRPYLFGAASPPAGTSPANPGVRVPPPASPFAVGSTGLANSLDMSDEEYRKHRYGSSLHRPNL